MKKITINATGFCLALPLMSYGVASSSAEDERMDLAILKIEPEGNPFPFLEFTDSDTLEVGDLSPAHAIELGMPAFASGVMVTSVTRSNIAERYGLRPRNILLTVNGQKITEAMQAQSVLLSEKDTWEIQIRRKGRTLSFRGSS